MEVVTVSNCCQNKSKHALLKEIMALNFAVNDLVLYLDTHPSDRCALKKHSEYVEKVIKLTEEYQKLYGPLTFNYTNEGNCWQWADEPWPWERGAY